MKLKLDSNNAAVVQDGKPVLVYDDGREAPLDFVHLIGQVKKVSDERDELRTKAETAEATLKAFGGAKPEDVAKAIETHKNLEAKKLIDAGKVEEVVKERIGEAQKSWDAEKLKLNEELTTERSGRRSDQLGRLVGESKFLREKTFLTPDLFLSRWDSALEVKDGKVIGFTVNAEGKKSPVYSREKPGEIASGDELLAMLVEQHPSRDTFMKGNGAGGSGATQTQGGGNGAGKTMNRAAFDSLPPAQREAEMAAGTKLTD